jgi:hypothetical protein
MKRFMARGRGKSSRIEKWFSHIKIVVAERAEAVLDDMPDAATIAAVDAELAAVETASSEQGAA